MRRTFSRSATPWGSAIDYRCEPVRAFAIEMRLYWLAQYRFDGLRLDAVHAIPELGKSRCCMISASRWVSCRGNPPHPIWC